MLSWLTRDSGRRLGSNASNKRFDYGWVVLAVCLILITVTYGIRFSYGVFFESLEKDFGWTRTLTSSVFSVYMLLGALFAVVGGWAADRYGVKVVFMVMAFFCFLGLALTSQVSALWQMYLSYSLLVAMGTGPTYIVATTSTTKWFKERRALSLAIVSSGVGLGSILTPPVASYLITSYGWRTSFLAIGLIAFIVMIPCSLLLKRSPVEAELLSQDKQPKSRLNVPDGRDDEFKEYSIIQAITSRNFLLVVGILFFYAFCFFMVMTHIVRHATDLGIGAIQAASILSISGVANIPPRLLTGLLSDRFGRKQPALICTLVMAAAMFWLTQSSSLWMLYVFAAVFGAASGSLAPPIVAIIGDTFGVRHIGVILGISEVGWVSGSAVGPALAGYIFDTTGTYSLAFWIGIVGALIASVLALFLRVAKLKTRSKTTQQR